MKKALFVCIVVFCYGLAVAQAPTALAFPSANNNFLGQVGSGAIQSQIGVDLFTGAAQINVPICNLASKQLNIPVSIAYTGARGIKVQDYATCVGLGWQLNAGGGVSRIVRGYPDELPNGYLGTGQWGKQVASSQTNGTALSSQITGVNGTSFSNPTADGEPDIFYVKTPAFSFRFTFDENGVAILPNNNGYNIVASNFYNTSNYQNASFKVIDNYGNQYFFGSSSQTVEKTTATLYGTAYTFPTTWYLEKIVSFNAADNVVFNYISAPNNEVANHYLTTRLYASGCNPVTTNSTVTSTVLQPKLISGIVSANGEIDFTYAFDRRDISNSSRLNTIELKATKQATTTTLQTFTFNTSYFGDPSSDPNVLRLRLDNITLSGNTSVTSALPAFKTFTYNNADNLPTRTSQSFDYWGFYNSLWQAPTGVDGDPMADPTLRKPNESRTKANILTSVKDISGGSSTVDYELNSYFRTSDNTNVAIGGLRVKTLSRTLPTGENIQTNYSYVDTSGHSTGQILTPSYINLVNDWGGVIDQVLSETLSNVYDVNGVFVSYSTVRETNQNSGYTVSSFKNFSDAPDLINYVNGNNPNSVPNVSSSTSYAHKRGVPASKVVYAASGAKISEDVFTYTSLNNPVSRKSWGYHWYIASYNSCSASGYNGFSSTYSSVVENYRLSQVVHKDYDQKTPANSLQRSTVYAYSTKDLMSVRSISTNNSKGSTQLRTFYYANDMDNTGAGIPMISAAERTAITDMQGKNNISSVIHESANNNGAITQSHNAYTNFDLGSSKGNFLTEKDTYSGSTIVSQEFFNYDLANANLISSYTQNGKSTALLYGYNSSYPIAKVVNAASTSSATLSSTTTGSYVNLGSSGSFTTANLGSITLQVSFGSYPGASNITTANYTLSGPATASGTLCYTMTGSGCSYGSSITLSNMPAGTYTLTASGSTNTPSSNPNISYSYPTYTSTIAYVKEFFYEDFEQGNGNSTGNAHTGTGYYVGTYSLNYAPVNGRSYVLQWWSYSGSSWSINEQTYTGPTSLTGTIDDVRIFPVDAQMTTYAYSPLVGKTGEIDISGRTSFFEYDGLGRMNIIRDNDRNIVKKYCYNYAGQNTGCSLFINAAQSKMFNKNNCTSGVGSAIVYNVPAGTFGSSISQADADQQATNDINNNGQNYTNANGTCCQATFNWANGITYTYSNLSLSGSTVNLTLVFTFPAGYTSVNAGTIAGNCFYPLAMRTVPININGSIFNMIISPSGNVQVVLVSGSVPSGAVGFTGVYDLFSNSYYSAAKSGTFTRNNCSTGQTGSTITYSVPVYKYTSTISQADADNKAQNDVNANGQNYANSTGTCATSVTITGSNSKTLAYVVSFTNTTTGAAQSFYISSGVSNATLGTVAAGTYNVMFQPAGQGTSVNFSIGSSTAYGVTSYTFTGVSITATTLAKVF